jgi:hypothetical protein
MSPTGSERQGTRARSASETFTETFDEDENEGPSGGIPFDNAAANRGRTTPGDGVQRALIHEFAGATETPRQDTTAYAQYRAARDRGDEEAKADDAPMMVIKGTSRDIQLVELKGAANVQWWDTKVRAKCAAQGFLDVLEGRKKFSDCRNERERMCWDVCNGKAHLFMVNSIPEEIGPRMRRSIEAGLAATLYRDILKEYDGMPPRNRLDVEGELLVHYLKPTERMEDYINYKNKLLVELEKTGERMSNEKVGEILLTRASRVYPELGNEFARMKALNPRPS